MSRHYLLFDRRWIWPMEGALAPTGSYCFRVFEPPKHNQPVLVADKPWEAMSLGWVTVLLDGGRYRMWYECWDETYKHDAEGRLCYAESDDGLTWRKPSLGLVAYRGLKDNNILIDPSMTFGLGLHGSSVFIDPTAEPAERYKTIFIGSTRPFLGEGGIGPTLVMQAFSADGLHWKMKEHPIWSGYVPPMLAYASDTQSVAFWDPGLRKYVGYFRSWEMGYARSIARAETSDFYNWPQPRTIYHCDEHDPFGTDIYNNAANRYESGGDVAYFLFMSMFEHGADTLDVQLATSRDGLMWSRSDRSRFIKNGPNRFDRGAIYTGPSIVPFKNDLAVYYHGCSYKHGEAVPAKISYEGAMGLVTLPRDRFQGLHTDSTFECCLDAFTLESDRFGITANVRPEAGGEFRAQLMLPDGTTIPGMTFAECEPIAVDDPAAKITWRSSADLHPHLGKKLHLRLSLKKCTVYALDVAC